MKIILKYVILVLNRMQNIIKPFDGLGPSFVTIGYCDALRDVLDCI